MQGANRVDRIPGYTDADMQALEVLVKCQLETNKVVRELAHQIVAVFGNQLPKQPQTTKPKRRGRYRYSSITRHGPGEVTAEVVNEETGRIRR